MKYLFLDLDNTILDFDAAEKLALSKTLRSFGLEPEETVLDRYHHINIWHWQQLEKGLMNRQQVLVGRFGVLFQEFSLDVDPQAVASSYEKNLGIGHIFLPGAEEAVKRLSEKYELYLASNGTASVQHSRLTSAGLYPYFKEVFVSQNLGFNKPSRDFFDGCFQRIPGFRVENAIMVGDSLSSDILGGINAGMKTVWVNPSHAPARADIQPDYEIESITQLEELLQNI